MALIVEDGTGLATAEAFVSVANAQTYLSSFAPLASAWTSANLTTKEDALRAATVYLEAVYLGRWPGLIVKDAQALAWPRQEANDQEARLISSTTVPAAVAKACAVAAAEHIIRSADGGLFPTEENVGNVKREKVSVGKGAVMEETEYTESGKQTNIRIPLVGRLLRGLIYPKQIGGETYRV